MKAMTIAERRNITPAVKLNEILQCAKSGRYGKEAKQSSQYHMDMNSRKLPPPLVFWSDSEKDAWIKNRNEESRLHKILDHLNIQETVCEQIFKKEAGVMRTRSAKFRERVKGLITLGEMEDDCGEKAQEGKAISPVEEKPVTPDRSREYISYRIETKHGVIKKTMARSVSIACDMNISKDPGDGDDDVESLAPSEWSLTSAGRAIRAMSAANKNHPKPSSAGPYNRRAKSAFPVSRLPKLDSPTTVGQETKNDTDSDGPMSPRSRQSSRNHRKSAFYSSAFAAEQLRRELRDMRKKRLEKKPIVFDFQEALQREKTNHQRTEENMKQFYSKVKLMRNVPLTKWELKSIEGQLKLG